MAGRKRKSRKAAGRAAKAPEPEGASSSIKSVGHAFGVTGGTPLTPKGSAKLPENPLSTPTSLPKKPPPAAPRKPTLLPQKSQGSLASLPKKPPTPMTAGPAPSWLNPRKLPATPETLPKKPQMLSNPFAQFTSGLTTPPATDASHLENKSHSRSSQLTLAQKSSLGKALLDCAMRQSEEITASTSDQPITYNLIFGEPAIEQPVIIYKSIAVQTPTDQPSTPEMAKAQATAACQAEVQGSDEASSSAKVITNDQVTQAIIKCISTSDQTRQTGIVPAADPSDALQLIDAKLVAGEKTLTPTEQSLLYHLMVGMGGTYKILLGRVVTDVSNRDHRLTFQLALWFYRQGDYMITRMLLKERLNDMEGAEGDLMDLDEVDELMDCQIALEKLEETMGIR
ncbi:hypothetical protein DL768_001964 [Monosporascus sp. mg162]|nr:hypothetical protein DL768_001964 [Monosporascus sp. mg162]